MAVTTEFSTQFTAGHITQGGKNDNVNYGASLQTFRFTFTQGAAAGDATSVQKLIKVPPGKWTMYCPQSFAQWSAFGAARTLDIGWEAYVDKDGVAVSADADGIETVIDVSAAGQQAGLGDGVAAGVGRCIDFTSRDGVNIVASVLGGTIPAAAKISGHFLLAGGGN
jgi:hypothetical protein